MVVRRLAGENEIRISKKGFSSLWAKGEVAGREAVLLLPQTFMNRSGESVREAAAFYRTPPEDLLVVHDDLDLPLGRVKTDFNAGGAGHRGVGSIIELLGTKSFHRIRIGIGRPERKEEVEGHVLSPFDKSERGAVEAVVSEAVREINEWVESRS